MVCLAFFSFGLCRESVKQILELKHRQFAKVCISLPQSYHFYKGKLCLAKLLEFFEKFTKPVDRGEPVVVIYLDFQS